MQELEKLNDKIEKLLKKHADAKADNQHLKELVSAQAKQIESLAVQLTLQEQQTMAKGITSTVQDVKEREIMRKQLDTVLADIDKILATLND
jgi:predicted lipase